MKRKGNKVGSRYSFHHLEFIQFNPIQSNLIYRVIFLIRCLLAGFLIKCFLDGCLIVEVKVEELGR